MRHLAALGESPVTQKMGTARYSHRFRSPSLFETTHFDERKSDGSPHFLPAPFCGGLLTLDPHGRMAMGS